MRHTSLAFTWVKLCKKPDANSKPANSSTFINIGIAFPKLGGMQLPLSWPAPATTRALASEEVLDLLRSSETRVYKDPNNTMNNNKSQIKNQKNGNISHIKQK